MSALQVAFLRGVNVGGRNPVPMAELRSVLESSGCRDVRTYVQSGNVIERSFGVVATARNLTTLAKIVELGRRG